MNKNGHDGRTPLDAWLRRNRLRNIELASMAGVSEWHVSRARNGWPITPKIEIALKQATRLKRL